MATQTEQNYGFSKAAYEWAMAQPSGLEWEACDPATPDSRLIEIVQNANHDLVSTVAKNTRMTSAVANAILDINPSWVAVERLASNRGTPSEILERIFKRNENKGKSFPLMKKLLSNPAFPKELLGEYLPKKLAAYGETQSTLAVLLNKRTPIASLMEALPFVTDYNKFRAIKARRADINKHLAATLNMDVAALRKMPADLLVSLF